MKRTALSLLLIALFAVACSQPQQPAPAPTAQPQPTTAPATPAPSGDLSAAEAAALAQLAEALGLTADQIALVSSEAVEWPDSCLGISYPNARCAQAITPGFRLTFEAAGLTYEVHTNADGSAVALAVPTLSWHREGGIAGFCDDLFVSGFGTAQAGNCRSGESYPEGQLTAAELAQLNDWARQYSSVVIEESNPQVSDDMPITLIMSGSGSGQPTEAEQQAMLSWAQDVYNRLQP